MLSGEQVQKFQKDGFVLGPKVLDDAQLEKLRSELDRVIADHDRKDVPQPVMLSNLCQGTDRVIWQIVNMYDASAAFRDLVFHREIVRDSATLLGARQLRVWHDQIQYKPSDVGGVNMWHQDSPLWPILTPKDQQITAWVALDDATEENGCMSMVPASHLWGEQMKALVPLKQFTDLPREYEGHRVEVRLCPVPRGHVHFHHSLTWHGSHSNTSGKPRRAIALHYMNEATRYTESGRHVMKPFVTIPDGHTLTGERFPLVWDHGHAIGA